MGRAVQEQKWKRNYVAIQKAKGILAVSEKASMVSGISVDKEYG